LISTRIHHFPAAISQGFLTFIVPTASVAGPALWRLFPLTNHYPTMHLKTNTQLTIFLLMGLLLFSSSACNLLKNQVGNIDVKALLEKTQPTLDTLSYQAGLNAANGAASKAQLISQNLIAGLKGSMDTLDPDIQKIMRTIDSLGNMTDAQLIKLGETLEARLDRLKTNIKDEELKKYLVSMVEGVTGKLRKDTKYLLSDMIQSTLDSLGSASSKEKIKLIINSLLGEDTKKQAQDLIQGALQPTMDTLLNRIDKIVHKDVPFVQRQANKLLISLGLLAAAIIGFVWYQRRRYAKLVGLLTYQIDKLSSKEAYDELTHQIKNEAQKTGLEPLLRETLKEQGINN